MKNYLHKQLLAATVDPSGILTICINGGKPLARPYYNQLIRKYREESKYAISDLMENFKKNLYWFAYRHHLGHINRGRMTAITEAKPWMFERIANLMRQSDIQVEQYVWYLFECLIPFRYEEYKLQHDNNPEREDLDIWNIFSDTRTYSLTIDRETGELLHLDLTNEAIGDYEVIYNNMERPEVETMNAIYYYATCGL